MVFRKNDVRLVQMRQFQSKAGNTLTFLKIADKATFDSVEVLAEKGLDLSVISEGSDYDLELDYDGRYMSARLLPMAKK